MSQLGARVGQGLALCSECLGTAELLITPQALETAKNLAESYGPTLSGALFGAGWWFWADACVSSTNTVPFVQYMPGITATIALIMINAVRREELEQYDAFDEGVFCRSRFWLFLSYVVSFASVIGAVWVLLQCYLLNGDASEAWPGVAGLFQVLFILGAALVFFVARTPAESGGYEYSSF